MKLSEKYAIAIAEAKRFLLKAEIAKERGEYTKENAAAKRASMDLSRALSELRKGDW